MLGSGPVREAPHHWYRDAKSLKRGATAGSRTSFIRRTVMPRYPSARSASEMWVQAASRRNALAFHLPALLARPAFHWAEKSGAADLDWLYGGGPA